MSHLWWEPPERDPEAERAWEDANTSEPQPKVRASDVLLPLNVTGASLALVLFIFIRLLMAREELPLEMRGILMSGYVQLLWIAVFLAAFNLWLWRRALRRFRGD